MGAFYHKKENISSFYHVAKKLSLITKKEKNVQ